MSDITKNERQSNESVMANFFGLKGDSWLRHANPASVWSRYVILVFMCAAVWSRIWIGWFCLIPLAVLVVWAKINPLFFPKPRSINSWTSKCVIGEMMFSNRKNVTISGHHLPVIWFLYAVQFAGVAFIAWGLYFLDLWPMLLGLVLVYLGKTWFLDRMVWIYQEMASDSRYQEILKDYL
jgi:hypothetical protein